MPNGSSLRYDHADHLSVRVTTDTNGGIVAQSGHYPFGEKWYETGGTNKVKFTSYERDAESLNDYAIFRTHINRLGRFNAPDPIAGSLADPQSLNRYAYVLNDPVGLVDPLGLEVRVSRPGETVYVNASAIVMPTVTYNVAPPYGMDLFEVVQAPDIRHDPSSFGGLPNFLGPPPQPPPPCTSQASGAAPRSFQDDLRYLLHEAAIRGLSAARTAYVLGGWATLPFLGSLTRVAVR